MASSTVSSDNRKGITSRKIRESIQYPPRANMLIMKYFAHCYRLKTNLKKMRYRINDHTILPSKPAGLMPTPSTSAQTKSRAKQHTEATKRAISGRS